MRTFPLACLAWLVLCAGACTHDFDAPFAEWNGSSDGSAGAAGLDASAETGPDGSGDVADATYEDAKLEGEAHAEAAPDGDAGPCFPGTKLCGSSCVKNELPEYGCAPDKCDPCTLANATSTCSGVTCAVDKCVSPFLDCNGNPVDGCETPNNTLSNCAACGQLCSLSHAISECSDGIHCNIATCETGYDNCNQNSLDGCEAYISGDVGHCGACGHVCTPPSPGVKMKCSNGACLVDNCAAGAADCDNDNVCEVNTDTDPDNCASCGHVCSFANAAASCVAGVCKLDSCSAGFADCNGQPSDGCEINILSNLSHCGSCNAPCSTSGGSNPSCDQGLCSLTCAAGYANCNGPAPGNSPADDGCEINTGTDKSNCGGCGAACSVVHGSAPVCASGLCSLTCDTGYLDCDGPTPGADSNGCEVHKTDDELNCGSCGSACGSINGTATCTAGACGITCNAGFANCDNNVVNGCEINIAGDTSHCGSCNTICNSSGGTPACVSGACTIACNSGYGNCDNNASNGCEVNLTDDESHCGSCATACSTNHGSSQCIGGSCQVQACSPGFGNCDSDPSDACETDTLTNVAHCGPCSSGCNGACPGPCTKPNATPICVAGGCAVGTCNPGYLDCGASAGCETNGQTDPLHCGSCTKVCSSTNGTPGCSLGACTIQCNTLYGNCDSNIANGCEKALANDTSNCGACGKVCGTAHGSATCAAGVCAIACDSGYENCNGISSDGCETALSSVNNCGACGVSCTGKNATWACAGACMVVQCVANYGNCDGDHSNGCEANFLTDNFHCGDCATACVTNKVCKNGLCSNP